MERYLLVYLSSFQPNREVPAETSTGSGDSMYSSTTVANTTVVRHVSGTVRQKSNTITSNSQSSESKRTTSSTSQETYPVSRACLRRSFKEQKVSERTTEILISAWKHGTHKQYGVYIRKWYQFCSQRKVDGVKPSIVVVLDFLTKVWDIVPSIRHEVPFPDYCLERPLYSRSSPLGD